MTIFIMPLLLSLLLWCPQLDMFQWVMAWYLVGAAFALVRRLSRRKRERAGSDA